MVTYIGFFAGALTTGCLIPQIIQTHKTKSAKDFSLFYLVALIIGVASWVIYGILLKDFPIILANIIALILISFILYTKLKY
ncbi:MAG: SemiSWEET transporter [Patescibacteria group bacterium]|jgi:MtN3 and saliva related transmembrane protein|nr:SemiSWEET transporter [Patescibacteria group bacterium]